MAFFKKSKHRKIVPNQTFLDGTNRYEKGKVYRVEMGLARYFDRNGWLEDSETERPSDEPSGSPFAPNLVIEDVHVNMKNEVT
jgi:hypothetical protein